METKARFLPVEDCGSLLLAQCRTPYVVGCLLPHTALRVIQTPHAQLEAKFVFHKGQAALELQVLIASGGIPQQLTYLVSYPSHQTFLHHLKEASALYLLTGHEHPVAYADNEQPHRKTLAQRVHESGLAVEVTEAVRNQIYLLTQFHAAKQALLSKTP